MFNFTLAPAYCLQLEQTVQTFETLATVGKTQNEGKYLKALGLIQNGDFQISAICCTRQKRQMFSQFRRKRKSLILLGIVCWEYIHPSVISFCKSNQTLGGNSNVFQMLTLMYVDSFPLLAKFKSSLTASTILFRRTFHVQSGFLESIDPIVHWLVRTDQRAIQ